MQLTSTDSKLFIGYPSAPTDPLKRPNDLTTVRPTGAQSCFNQAVLAKTINHVFISYSFTTTIFVFMFPRD